MLGKRYVRSFRKKKEILTLFPRLSLQSISKEGQHPRLIGVTCLFLACKVEEDMRPVREFIWAMNKIDVDGEGNNLYPYGTTGMYARSHSHVQHARTHLSLTHTQVHIIWPFCRIGASGIAVGRVNIT